MQNPIALLLINETRFRLLDESIPRLRKCLKKMSKEQIWYRPNAQTVSAGNLVLHLCGNIRQWLISGLGGYSDHRVRQREFDEKGPLETKELMFMLDQLTTEIEDVLSRLPGVDLTEKRKIQGFEVNGVTILVHVVEHFSYHVGQVTLMVKSRLGINMGYYGGKDLDILNP